VRSLKFCLASRKWFELFETQNPKALTDIQRAVRFFFLQKNAFGGLIVKQNYHYCIAQPPNFNPENIPKLIENTHARLARVQLECLPYQEILRRYDRPESLFYCDPPYFNRRLYRFNFSAGDFVTLEENLRQIRGKFILSLNDVPEVRQIFHGYHLQEIQFSYSAPKAPGKRYNELLIANFDLNQREQFQLARKNDE
jgi:DNA adenine methylase